MGSTSAGNSYFSLQQDWVGQCQRGGYSTVLFNNGILCRIATVRKLITATTKMITGKVI